MKLRYVLLTAAYCAGIFWLSSRPIDIRPEWTFPGQDKLAHIFLYGGLAAVISVGLRRARRPAAPIVQFYFPIVFAVLYGISDEIHQLFVPSRSCDMMDALADLMGAAMTQWLLCFRYWRIPVRTVFPGR